MTQEEKELLLKDLCARLPYGVICKDTNINVTGTLSQIGLHYDMCVLDKDNGDSESCYILNCKPYLFPLSSMNDEMWDKEFMGCNITEFTRDSFKYGCETLEFNNDNPDLSSMVSFINQLIKNHFDVNGLIPMNLANDATNKNIY